MLSETRVIFTCAGVPVKHRPWRLGIAHIASAVLVRGLRPRCASSKIQSEGTATMQKKESADPGLNGTSKCGRLELQTLHKVPSSMHDAGIEAGCM